MGHTIIFFFSFLANFLMLRQMGASQEGLALNSNRFLQLVQKVK
jgi:hypothetical protein